MTTIVSGTSMGGWNQRRVAVTENGVLWAAVFGASTMAFRFSVDDGATWEADEGSGIGVGLSSDASMVVGQGGTVHLVAKHSDGSGVYYHQGTLNAAHTAISWTYTRFLSATRYNNAGIAAYRYGDGWRAHIVGHINPEGETYHTYVTKTSGTDAKAADEPIGFLGGSAPIVWNQGGFYGSPTFWVALRTGSAQWIRRHAANGWSAARLVAPTGETRRAGYHDGTRFVLAYANGSLVNIRERNLSDTETTNRVSPALPTGSVLQLAAATDSTDDIHLAAVGSDGDPYVVTFDRSAGTWGSWTLIAAASSATHLKLQEGFRQIEAAWIDGGNAVHGVAVSLPSTPSTPTWNTLYGVEDLNASLVPDWTYTDVHNDPQDQYELSRSVDGGAVQYWNGSGWVGTQTQVTSSASQVTLPGGWGTSGQVHQFWVRVWDDTGLVSQTSAALVITAAVKINPVIVAPLPNTVLDAPTTVMEWTCAEQKMFKVRVLSPSGSEWYSSGWIRNADIRQWTFTNFGNNSGHVLEVTTRSNLFLDSDPKTVLISVLYTPPPVPQVVALGGEGYVEVMAENPQELGLQPVVTHNDLFRAEATSRVGVADVSQLVRIASGLSRDFTYTDYAVRSDRDTAYVVIAYADDGQQQSSEASWVNYLTRHQSNVENPQIGLGGFTAGANTTIARSTVNPVEGSASLELTVVADGDAEIELDPKPVPAGVDLTNMVTLRDTGVQLEARIGEVEYNDIGEVIGSTWSDWATQELRDQPEPSAPEVLSIRYSVSPNMSNAQEFPAQLAGLRYVFLYGLESGKDLPAGWTVTWKLDGVTQSADTTSPYQLKGGTAATAVPLDLNTVSEGAHTITADVDRGSGVEPLSVSFTKIPSAVPTLRYGGSSSPDGSSPLNGATWDVDARYVFADMTGITDPVAYVRLINENTSLSLWQESDAPYGDVAPVTLADGVYNLHAEVTLADGATVVGPTATFTVDAPEAPTGGDLGNGYNRAALLAQRWGYGRFAGGTGDASADDALTWTHVVVDSVSELQSEIESGGQKWITGTPGKTMTGNINIDPGHGRFVVDGRGCTFKLTASGGEGFQLNSSANRNIILAYLTFERPSALHDSIRIAGRNRSESSDYPKDIWVHHVTINGTNDGGIDITRNARDVTVDWVRFNNGVKTALWGGDDTSDVSTSTTISAGYIYWNQCVDRQPRMRYGFVHIINSYWYKYGYAIVSHQDAKVLAEGVIFDAKSSSEPAIHYDQFSSDTTKGEGRVGAYLALNGAEVNERNPGNVATPGYAYTVETPNQALINKIVAGAGNV